MPMLEYRLNKAAFLDYVECLTENDVGPQPIISEPWPHVPYEACAPWLQVLRAARLRHSGIRAFIVGK